jgi:hypothetical protein
MAAPPRPKRTVMRLCLPSPASRSSSRPARSRRDRPGPARGVSDRCARLRGAVRRRAEAARPGCVQGEYASAVVCLDAHADQAAQLLDKCRPPPIRARACAGARSLRRSGSRTAEGPRGRGLPLVPLVAGALCRAELSPPVSRRSRPSTRRAEHASGRMRPGQPGSSRTPGRSARARTDRAPGGREPGPPRRTARVLGAWRNIAVGGRCADLRRLSRPDS